jgi:acyl-CoA synthetase (AMP-forming)/AMP-acid ligase II
VIGEGPPGEQTVVAVLVSSAALPQLEITEWCARELSPHKRPRRVDIVTRCRATRCGS